MVALGFRRGGYIFSSSGSSENLAGRYRMFVSPDSFMVPSGFAAFDDSGQLIDEGLLTRATQITQQFNIFANRLIKET